jgi:hypothetical protein
MEVQLLQSKAICSRSTLMPSRMSIGDWRAPPLHLFQPALILLQLAGPNSPSYVQNVPLAGGGGVAAMTAARTAFAAASFFALVAAAMRATWLARMAARRSAIFAYSSASAISSCSRADGFFVGASFVSFDDGSFGAFAFDGDSGMGGRIEALTGSGGSFALAVATARQQATRAKSLRMLVRKVEEHYSG